MCTRCFFYPCRQRLQVPHGYRLLKVCCRSAARLPTISRTAPRGWLRLSSCLQVVKSKLQTQNIFAPDRYTGMWDCAQRLYRAEGWRALWRGFTPCLVRSIPANSIAFLTFEGVRSRLSA